MVGYDLILVSTSQSETKSYLRPIQIFRILEGNFSAWRAAPNVSKTIGKSAQWRSLKANLAQ
jgi:hypothetical protein